MTKYLGCLAGTGQLQAPGMVGQQVAYEFDGFCGRNGQISASGEINAVNGALDRFFGQAGLLLVTDDGQKLRLKLSETKATGSQAAVHVDLSGTIPGPAKWLTEQPMRRQALSAADRFFLPPPDTSETIGSHRLVALREPVSAGKAIIDDPALP